MRFHCLLPIRDEADIVGQCLEHLLTWADAIYVFDTGSVDDTWEIVQNFASTDKRVKPLKKDYVYFSENLLRGWLFHQARQQMGDGDWFLRVDADEFHHIPPPEFVRTRMRPHETIAYHQYYDFRFTESEMKAWQAGKETLADRRRPIGERRRSFTPSLYSEPRLCCYRETMQWPPAVSFPFNAGFVARERLPIRHYPHRDPVQLERRCRLRTIMMTDKENRAHWTQPELHHWSERDWRKFITPDNLAGLQRWQTGTDLPEFKFVGHLAKHHKRVAQRFAHAFCLPVLDRLRSRWPEEAYPQKISAEIQAELESNLRAK
jgi:Glycosyl transferase family 2